METIPTTLDQAITLLTDLNIDPQKIDSRTIRNKWGLWAGSDLACWFYSNQIYHADDMSAIIIDSYHRSLQGQEINLASQIKKYHDHWYSFYGNDHLNIMRSYVSEHIQRMRGNKIDKSIEE